MTRSTRLIAMVAVWVAASASPCFAQEQGQGPDQQLLSEAHSPVGTLQSRRDGSLWVLSSRGQFGQPDEIVSMYDVFDAKGRFAQQLAIKANADSVNDLIALVGDYMIVVTDFLPSMMALQGGTAADEEEDEEAEPMQVICYRLDAPKLGMN